jgi:hypothetical protein
LKNNVPLPHDSIITITLPKMNLEAPRSLRKSYIVDPNNLSCRAVEGVDLNLACKFESVDTENDKITITGILPNGQPEIDTQMIIAIS